MNHVLSDEEIGLVILGNGIAPPDRFDLARAIEASVLAKLTAERDALKKDAERYRFLKKGFGRCSFEIMEQCEEDGEYYGVSLVKGNYIDDKIDAAIKEETK